MKASLINRLMGRRRTRQRKLAPADGYNLWASTFDSQPDNVVLDLESRLFSRLLNDVSIEGKTVIDIGCGTGRHWQEILTRHPLKLIGADPSSGMTQRLKLSFPDATLICGSGDRLLEIADESCDVIVSTLALAHIPDAARALSEWRRILGPGGSMLITDFHNDAIRAGMKRTFVHGGETIEIEHHATELDRLRSIALASGLNISSLYEGSIDSSVRDLFERQKALDAYERHKGLNLVFGVHLTRS